jgi:hypothetical protein
VIPLLIGIGLGGWVVWRYRGELEAYLAQLGGVQRTAGDLLAAGKDTIKHGLQATREATRPAASPEGPDDQPHR